MVITHLASASPVTVLCHTVLPSLGNVTSWTCEACPGFRRLGSEYAPLAMPMLVTPLMSSEDQILYVVLASRQS